MNLLTNDDTLPTASDTDHLHQRQAAFAGGLDWHGLPLRWTISRASLYALLRVPAPRLSAATLQAIQEARDAPDNADLQQRANDLFEAETAGSDTRFRNATIILYLAAHDHKTWQPFSHNRERFLSEIEQYVDENVAPNEIAQLAAITTRLIEDAESTRAKVRPSGNPDEEHDAGN